MELSKLFIYNLKKWRKEKGISQKKLAERCEATHSYIRQIESGRGHPSFIFIGKLARALNVEPYQLFFDETIEKSGNSCQSNGIESIKACFLDKVSNEFDIVVKKLQI